MADILLCWVIQPDAESKCLIQGAAAGGRGLVQGSSSPAPTQTASPATRWRVGQPNAIIGIRDACSTANIFKHFQPLFYDTFLGHFFGTIFWDTFLRHYLFTLFCGLSVSYLVSLFFLGWWVKEQIAVFLEQGKISVWFSVTFILWSYGLAFSGKGQFLGLCKNTGDWWDYFLELFTRFPAWFQIRASKYNLSYGIVFH